MFTLKREKGVYTLYDKASRIAFISPEITNPLFVAFAVSGIRKDIKDRKVTGGFELDFKGGARAMNKNMQVVQTMVQHALAKGITTVKAETMDDDGEICKTCGGTGEVSLMDNVYPNEQHQALVGSGP